MIEQGATVYWSAGAVVFETIPEKRASLNWLIKRSFNGAVTFTKVLKIERNYTGLVKKFLVNIIYFIVGCIALILIPFPYPKKILGYFQDFGKSWWFCRARKYTIPGLCLRVLIRIK